MAPYTISPYPLNVGTLGHIEGLTLISSTTSTAHCHYFGGVPYALPPVGPYRFRPPRPLPALHRYGTRANPGRFAGKTALCPQPGYREPPDKTLWDEDCLQLNVWLPAGQAPEGGWPVFFFLHGGWLQFGTANIDIKVVAQMLGETAFKAIIVRPSYRLNMFGFLASKELEIEAQNNGETVGNMGFWDQRIALEWTSKNIHLFGGNREMITCGGYSAGSHSAFQQLAHDLNQPREKAIIKRTIMWSNGPGVQAKFLPEAQDQFDELLGHLGIPLSVSSREKLDRLRNASVDHLVEVQSKLKISEFRALSDGVFIDTHTIEKINDGTFAKELKARGIRILNGECAEEWNTYASWRPPVDSWKGLYQRLVADYPGRDVKKVMSIYFPGDELPARYTDWTDAFGKVYADMQVYAMERGFADRLEAGGLVVGKDLLRYRIEWRAKCVDAFLPPEWGVTHSSDNAIWWWGNGWGGGLTDKEKEVLQPLNKIFADFVSFKDVQWPVKDLKTVLKLKSDGTVEMGHDEHWDHGLAIWDAINERDEQEKPKL